MFTSATTHRFGRFGGGLSVCAAAALLLAPSGTAFSETIRLTGLVRDFTDAHPDMEYPGDENYPVINNMVLSDLGADGKPVLNSADLDVATWRITSAASFDQWYRSVPGVNMAIPFAIELDNGQAGPGGTYSYAVEMPDYFFPIDGQGFGDTAIDANGDVRNFYFTYEIRSQFTYTDPASRSETLEFTFVGDDDVWVFINGKLAVDIGGVHSQSADSVDLDAKAAELGLVPGGTYTLVLFFAERHVSESNFRIDTTVRLEDLPTTTVSPIYD